jgi:hypothetical protein
MSARAGSIAGSLAIFLAAGTVTSVLFINLCGTLYQCGCQSLWAGAAQHCNIHKPGSKHCPWCSYGETGYAVVYGSMLGSQAILGFRPRRWSWRRRLLASLGAFPAVGVVLAVVLGLASGYWD